MAPTDGAKRPKVDWEAVEREYRAGLRSLADIGGEYGVSAPGILKRAKKDGWARDLSAKIKAKAEAKVNAALVNAEVNARPSASEIQTIEANAQLLADKVLNQRADIQRSRSIVQKLWNLVEVELDAPEEFEKLGELLRCEDEFGNDKLNELYRAAIGLPQQVKNAKALADALKVLIELERKVLKIDDQPIGGEGEGSALNDAQRASRIAFLLAKARTGGND